MTAQTQLDQLAHWFNSQPHFAVATVVETWGSAPQPVGSQLLVDRQGHFAGAVSGGCVEGEVVTAALTVLQTGQPRLLEFGVSDETAWTAGLACGGRIRIYVEAMTASQGEMIASLVQAQKLRQPMALVTHLPTGARRLVTEAGARDDACAADLAIAFHMDQSICAGDNFMHVYNPALHLIVIGAVQIAQSLIPLAQMTGYDVTVIDPRAAFASAQRFPHVTLYADWPDERLPHLALDSRTALLALTHDPKIDDPALILGLRSKLFYIGALGSKKTHQARVARLHGKGFGDEEIARIHAPIGLNIGARGATEIAVAIIGDIIRAVRVRE